MSEERLVEIETKLAQQEYLLNQLNDVITRQQESIMQLEERCGSLVDRLRSISESLPVDVVPQDERPPHY